MTDSADRIAAGDQWMPAADYDFIVARTPIPCVDVLLSPEDDPQRVGLIRRATYGGRIGWCLIGGRVLRNEHLSGAVERHVTATLGPAVQIDRASLKLRTVVEYFTERRAEGEFHDPRKHDIGITYTATCEGPAVACGEAIGFHWFRIGDLDRLYFGFGHGDVVHRLLKLRDDDPA